MFCNFSIEIKALNIPGIFYPRSASCHCFITQGAKKVGFTFSYLGKLQLACTGPKFTSTSPKTFWWAGLITQFICHLNSSKNFTCPSGKLRTEFTSLIAKSTSPGLPDTTFFEHCYFMATWHLTIIKINIVFCQKSLSENIAKSVTSKLKVHGYDHSP